MRPCAAPLKWVSRWTLTSCASSASSRDAQHRRVARDHQLAPGHEQAGDVVADLDHGVEARVGRAVALDQGARRRRRPPERADRGAARRACGRGRARMALGVGQQLRPDGPVVEQRRRLERGGVARRQHGQLVVDLLPLLGQQPLEQRILDDATGRRRRGRAWPRRDRRSAGGNGTWALPASPLAKKRSIASPAVDRRDRQQEIEAARDLVELLVGVERRGKEGASAERAEVGRRAGAARRHERAGRLEQRIAERDREIAGQLRIESVSRRGGESAG